MKQNARWTYRDDEKYAIDAPLPSELSNHSPIQTGLFPLLLAFLHMLSPCSRIFNKLESNQTILLTLPSSQDAKEMTEWEIFI